MFGRHAVVGRHHGALCVWYQTDLRLQPACVGPHERLLTEKRVSTPFHYTRHTYVVFINVSSTFCAPSFWNALLLLFYWGVTQRFYAPFESFNLCLNDTGIRMKK